MAHHVYDLTSTFVLTLFSRVEIVTVALATAEYEDLAASAVGVVVPSAQIGAARPGLHRQRAYVVIMLLGIYNIHQ